MPSVSRAQQMAMAIAEHNPDKLHSRNKGLLGMTHDQLHDFASTSYKGLLEHVEPQVPSRTKEKKRGVPPEMKGRHCHVNGTCHDHPNDGQDV